MQSGKIASVIVNDKRRLARDFDEILRLVLDLREYGVEAYSYREGMLNLADRFRPPRRSSKPPASTRRRTDEIARAREAVRERIDTTTNGL